MEHVSICRTGYRHLHKNRVFHDTLFPGSIYSIFNEAAGATHRVFHTSCIPISGIKGYKNPSPNIEDFIRYHAKRHLSSFFLKKLRFFAFFSRKKAFFIISALFSDVKRPFPAVSGKTGLISHQSNGVR
jgi:hypothetical protein